MAGRWTIDSPAPVARRRGGKADPMSQAPTLSPIEEVVTFLAGGPPREAIAAFRLSEPARERLRDLLRRNQAGLATADEARELDQMVLLDDILSLIRARGRRAPIAGEA
jgi:hypothetical protein